MQHFPLTKVWVPGLQVLQVEVEEVHVWQPSTLQENNGEGKRARISRILISKLDGNLFLERMVFIFRRLG